MKKITWYNDKLIYSLSDGENPFSNNFFSFYNSNNEILDRFIINVIDEKTISINGNFNENIHLKIGNIKYPFYLEEKTESECSLENYAGVKNESFIIEKTIEEDANLVEEDFSFIANDEKIIINNLKPINLKININSKRVKTIEEKSKLPIKIHMYTNEMYPDFPYKKNSLEINETHIISRETNVIYKIFINNNVYIVKDNPRFYWSNVNDLKEFLDDLDLNYKEKSIERFKKMIQEKSVYLKRRFGLVKIHLEDIEYFPLYKRLVNLYCLQELVTLNFINGVNNDSDFKTFNSGYNQNGNSLKLGNFQIGEDGGLDGYVFGPQAIRTMIENAERDLMQALFKEHGIAKKNTFKGGVFCAKQIFRKV